MLVNVLEHGWYKSEQKILYSGRGMSRASSPNHMLAWGWLFAPCCKNGLMLGSYSKLEVLYFIKVNMQMVILGTAVWH